MENKSTIDNSTDAEKALLEHLQKYVVLVQGSHFWVDIACWHDNLESGNARMYNRAELLAALKALGLKQKEASKILSEVQGSANTRVVLPACDKDKLPLHPAGYQIIDGKPWFIQNDSRALVAAKGNCAVILREICRMFGDEAPLLLGWLKGAYTRQLNYAAEMRGQDAPFRKVASQTLAIAGDPGTGKTHVLLDIIFAGLLGSYTNMPTAWLTGESRFNDWALKSNIWVADDGVSLQTIKKRKDAATILKNAGYSSKLTIECKNKAVFTLSYPCERIFVVNLQEYALRALPAYEENQDKFLFLHNCGSSGLMEEWGGDYDRMHQELTAAMPAFAHFLLHEYQLPEWTVRDTTRHTVADWGYMSPPILNALSEQDEAGILMARLRKAYMKIRNSIMIHETYSHEELRSLMEIQENKADHGTSTKMGKLMAECQRRWPHLLQEVTRHGYTCYKFIKHPDWENPQSLDISKMKISQPDPALLAAAGLTSTTNDNN